MTELASKEACHIFQKKEDHCLDPSSTAFMLLATTMVYLQTPAMGICQAGLIRRKNSLSMLMQTLTGLIIGSLMWYFIGFGLVFGVPSFGGYIGNPFDHVFFVSLPWDSCFCGQSIPAPLFATFQMMFALMTPVILTGAWAEKLTFQAFIIVMIFWPLLIYYPVAHWIWGTATNSNGWLSTLGVMDFAGGIVIHTTSGVAALTISLMLEKRKGLEHLTHSYHNLPVTVIGGVLIWAGWYFFNGGSALSANFQAANALLNTHIAACMGGLVWVTLSYFRDRQFHLLDILNGALAGLAGITPASGFVSSQSACFVGTFVAVVSYYSVPFFKNTLKIDDVLDVTSLQAVPGMIGAVMVGFFSTSSAQPSSCIGCDGIFYSSSGWRLLFVQVLAVVVCSCWSAFFTWGLFKGMELAGVQVQVGFDEEEAGLDAYHHGESAYAGEGKATDVAGFLDQDSLIAKLCDAAACGDVVELKSLIEQGAPINGSDYDKRTPLHLAASENQVAIMEALASAGALDLNPHDRFGGTPLMDAVRHGHDQAALWLQGRGVSIDKEQKSLSFSLCNASALGRTVEIQRLLRYGALPNCFDYDRRTPLHLAAAEGHLAAVQVLVESGASTDARDRWGNLPLDDAVRCRNMEIVQLLQSKCITPAVRDNDSDSESSIPLLTSVSFPSPSIQSTEASRTTKTTAGIREFLRLAALGDIQGVQNCIRRGVDPASVDYDGRGGLHVAAASGSLSVVQFLCLQKGVNVNAQDRWHQTALKEAGAGGHSELVKWLIANGATVMDSARGHDFCSAAASGNDDELARLLRSTNDANLADYDGRTALVINNYLTILLRVQHSCVCQHLAASEGHKSTVRLLLAASANVNVTDRFGGIRCSACSCLLVCLLSAQFQF
jgi:Amt family ammonium transporter